MAPHPPVEVAITTTRGNLACLLLDTLASTGVEYAVLHGEDRVAAGQADRDVEIAVAAPPHRVVRSLVPLLAESRLSLALVRPHDVRALAVLWLTGPGPDGAQFDLLCDPDGSGGYGVRTAALLQRRVRGRCWWRLDSQAERLYLLARQAGQQHQPGPVRPLDLAAADRRALVALAEHVLADWRRPHVLRLLADVPDRPGGYPVREVWPLWSGSPRLRPPPGQRPRRRAWPAGRGRPGTGCWLTLSGDPTGEVMRRLHRSFARVLPRARLLDAVAPLVVLQAQVERRHAGLAISRPVPGVRPDLALRAGEPRLTGRVLGFLAQRADRTLQALELAERRCGVSPGRAP